MCTYLLLEEEEEEKEKGEEEEEEKNQEKQVVTETKYIYTFLYGDSDEFVVGHVSSIDWFGKLVSC